MRSYKSMSSSVALASVLVAAAACGDKELKIPSPGEIAGDPVELAYDFQPGQHWRFDVEIANRMEMDGAGGTAMTIRYILGIRVVDVDAAGTANVELGIEEVTIEDGRGRPMPGGRVDFESVDISVKLTRSGAVEELRVTGQGGSEPYRTIAQQIMMPFQLAESTTRVNEPWTAEHTISSRLSGLATPVDFRADASAWITSADDDAVHIQSVTRTRLDPQKVQPSEASFMTGPVEVSSDGNAVSEIVFDRQRGMIRELEGKLHSKIDVKSSDDRMVIVSDATTRLRLRAATAAL
jgi:hypothetical protein